MKRTIYPVMILVALCLLLAACGPKATTQAPVATQAPAKAEKVTLELWMFKYSDPYMAWLNTAIAKFIQSHPNVAAINVSPKNDDELETGLIAAAASGTAPDVFINAIGFGAANVQAGLVHNIYDRWMAMPETYRSQWSAATIAGVTPKPGTMYVLPFSGYGYILYRNLTVLKAAGVDTTVPAKTLDEWAAQMKKVKDSGVAAIPNFTLDIRAVRIMYNSFSKEGEWGIDFTNNKSLINPDAWAKAGEFLLSVKPYALATTFGDQGVVDGFCTNTVAFTIGGPWMNPTYEACKNTKGLDYDFTVIPGVTADRVSGVSGGEYISINTLGKNADLAWEFITFLNDWPQQLEAAELSGQTSQNATAMEKCTNPVVKTVFKSLSTGSVLFDSPPFFVEAYPDNYEQTITDNMNAIYEGTMTPQDGTQKLLTDLAKLIADRKK
jgi:multiple sugar transport system substrate-binding protein